MRPDFIQTKELRLPPWMFSGVCIDNDGWMLTVFHEKRAVHALRGNTWEEVLEAGREWTKTENAKKAVDAK